jgi:hypothetical protein
MVFSLAFGNERQRSGTEAGYTHIHRDIIASFHLQIYHAARGFDRDAPAVRHATLGDKACKTARTVTALRHLAAVSIENAVTKFGIGLRRPFDQQQLVATDAKMAVGDKSHVFGGQVNRLIDRIDHNKIVADAVHFSEFDLHDA